MNASMKSASILIIETFWEQYKSQLNAALPDLAITGVSSSDELGSEIEDASIIMAFGPSLSDELVLKARKLEWLQLLSSGTDILSQLKVLPPHVLVSSTHGVHGPSVSEMAFLHMLTLARNYAFIRANQLAHRWVELDQVLLFKKTVVIVGTGVIARDLAKRCKAFGQTVIGISRAPREVENFDKMYSRDDLSEALSLADFVVLLAPLSAETRGMIDGPRLNCMKRSAYLINVGRGALCDEPALIEALRERRIAGAGLDAFAQEPLPEGHPFWEMDNVMMTPHIAGRNDQYSELVMPIILHNLKCFLAGRPDEMKNLQR